MKHIPKLIAFIVTVAFLTLDNLKPIEVSYKLSDIERVNELASPHHLHGVMYKTQAERNAALVEVFMAGRE